MANQEIIRPRMHTLHLLGSPVGSTRVLKRVDACAMCTHMHTLSSRGAHFLVWAP